MAGVKCTCGYVIEDGYDDDNIFNVISDEQLIKWAQTKTTFNTLFNYCEYEVMRCPKCGRLHVFSREHDFERIAVFVEEKQCKKK